MNRPPRNYAREIRTQIDDALASEDEFVPAVVAQKLVARLREKDPELLHGWLDEGAEHFIKEAINHTERSHRTHTRVTARRSVFSQATIKAEQGDLVPLTSFLATTYSVEGGVRKSLGSMTRDDLSFAAKRYEDQITQTRMAAMFLRLLAEKVGERLVRDVYTEEQVAQMWRGLVD